MPFDLTYSFFQHVTNLEVIVTELQSCRNASRYSRKDLLKVPSTIHMIRLCIDMFNEDSYYALVLLC
jgi:hypothetical protein